MTEYNPETHVAIPKEVLRKLEMDRIALVNYLTQENSIDRYLKVHLANLTSRIWKIANSVK